MSAGAERAAGPTAAGALLVTSAVHLGFQAVVTGVVYPALAELPPDRWDAAHATHRRRITVVVAPVYAALGAAVVHAVRSDPRASVRVAVAGATTAVLSTAVVAAPAHGRLARQGPDPRLLRRLRRSDAVRLAGALVAAGGALAAVLTES